MTLDDLIAKLPAQFKPWATQYGPTFLTMTADQFKAWFQLLIQGDIYTAYRQLLAASPTAEADIAAWDVAGGKLADDVIANADSIVLQKAALTKLLEIMLTLGLSVFGF
jgi:hypothetical protein